MELNDIYNFQDTIILCEIFGNRATKIMNKFPYSPQKCTSTSSLSGCIHRYLAKTIIALLTHAETVDLFKKTLIGRFSCVITRLAFDSVILLPKDNQNQFKENNLKVIYKIKNKLTNVVNVYKSPSESKFSTFNVVADNFSSFDDNFLKLNSSEQPFISKFSSSDGISISTSVNKSITQNFTVSSSKN